MGRDGSGMSVPEPPNQCHFIEESDGGGTRDTTRQAGPGRPKPAGWVSTAPWPELCPQESFE